jgi:hypothetical protein
VNRRGFLRSLFLGAAAVALAPAIDLLGEPKTPCGGGLLQYIQENAVQTTYREMTYEDLKEVCRRLDSMEPPEDLLVYGGTAFLDTFNTLTSKPSFH